MSVDLIPAVDTVARAIVASSAVVGVDPLKVYADGQGHVRTRLLALAAIVEGGLGSRKPTMRALALVKSNAGAPTQLRQASVFPEMVAKVVARLADAPRPAPTARPPACAPKAAAPPPPMAAPVRLPAQPRAEAPAPVRSCAQPGPAPRPFGGASASILKALADGAHTSMGLSSRLGLKEAIVCQALSLLKHEGKVDCDPLPASGRRAQYWRLGGVQ